MQSVGAPIWGNSASGAQAALGTRSAVELMDLASLSDAQALRAFYVTAAEAGIGGATAPIRIKLLDEITDAHGGSG